MNYYWEGEARTQHLYIPGASGYGKTTLMANLALDDLEYNDGPLIIIDPKGSDQGLVEQVLPHIPKSLIDKTTYISLKHPKPVDILGVNDQQERNFMKNDISTILQKFSFGSWGPVMQDTLNNLVPTLLEAPDATFLDLGKFLTSEKRREEILAQVPPERRQYWREHTIKSETLHIATRMSNFNEPPLSTIVNTRRNEGIKISRIIENNEILLVDTSPISRDGFILGAVILSRILQVIFRRSPGKKHPLCCLYVDEFHKLATDTFNDMLSQARSYGLSICLANQHPAQAKEVGVWDDVVGNVSSYAIFRMDGNHSTLLKSKVREPEYYPDPDEIRACKERLAEHKDTVSSLKSGLAKGFEGFDLNTAYDMREQAERKLQHYKDIVATYESNLARLTSQPKGLFDQIPHLERGEIIYSPQSGHAKFLHTPKPRVPTNASYAETIKKRAVDSSPRHTDQSPHTESNVSTTPDYDDIPPSPRRGD
jgi:TraM recognition site of TraD and TraG